MALASVKQGTIPVRRYDQNADINVTPFVDIMLVLLIIFMIAAPLVTTAIFVNNPPTQPTETPATPLVLSLNESGQIFVSRFGGDELVCTIKNVKTCVDALTHGNLSERLNVRADPGVRYGAVIEVMDTVKKGGYNEIAIVSEEVTG